MILPTGRFPDNDINNLYNATGKNGAAYQFVKVPLTKT